jgi:NAD(P)-dependent dehydrogenase (short-subunit alcohol dehydrogenase family)
MYSVEGKVAVITGAAQGIGAAAARLFVRQGAKVVLTDAQSSGSAVADELGDASDRRIVIVDDSIEAPRDIYMEGGDHTTLIHLGRGQFAQLTAEAWHGRFTAHD